MDEREKKRQHFAINNTRHHHEPAAAAPAAVRFASELSKFAASSSNAGVTRLAAKLSEARADLQLDGSGPEFQSGGDIPAYSQKLTAYLALVKGFTAAVASSTGAGAGAGAESQAAAPAVTDGSEIPGATLRQPLIVGAGEATRQTHTEGDRSAAGDRSSCLNFCRWRDVLSETDVYARSARHEYAQTLLAGGMTMLTAARLKVDVLLAERLSEVDETQLKLAYQLLLHASGVLDACLEAMDVTPRSIGAALADFSAQPEEAESQTTEESGETPDEMMMNKWRAEQRRVQQHMVQQQTAPEPTATAQTQPKPPTPDAVEDLAMLSRVPDLANGHFPQLLAWIALAEAQELAILRGVTREFVDLALMAKLAMDLSARYKECHTFASRSLPCSTSAAAERVQLYCAFKGQYYLAVATYYQGAACMQKEDARHCVQAIADLKKAATLFEQTIPHKKAYEAKLMANKEEKTRVPLLTSLFLRSQQIIDRDLDIVTHRNDSVYYEPVGRVSGFVSVVFLIDIDGDSRFLGRFRSLKPRASL
ncbi:hypothetical protein BBJ28_00019248 [Nothophytophthora sp. Chile5]|nr:hypothetical protein BBJ28_00019248 [Nothophytophthora sp. Chile5]